MSKKFPRIPHLPWSPGGSRDDRRLAGVDQLLGRPLVITEKLDGSNLCMTHKGVYARSHSGAPRHPSFDAAKALHAELQARIPAHLSVFGEWCWAVHSLEYETLRHPFHLFGVRDDHTDVWLPWNDVRQYAKQLGVITVPELQIDSFTRAADLRSLTNVLGKGPSRYGSTTEGVVVRAYGPVSTAIFDRFVGKWVRANHIQTDEHWSKRDFKKQRIQMP